MIMALYLLPRQVQGIWSKAGIAMKSLSNDSKTTRIQLVSATPYESETIGFSTKYKTTVMISI